MKKIVAVLALLACSIAWADVARTKVTWVRPDLYLTAEGAYIRTSGCTELTIDDTAVVRYFEGDDLLTFSYGVACRVVEVFK